MRVMKLSSYGLLLACLLMLIVLMNGGGKDTAVSAEASQIINGGDVPNLAISLIGEGFMQPVDITNAGDDRLFIVEQPGMIRIIEPDGSVLPAPFLDISDRTDAGGEQGLLGLAFDPNFEDTGYFYVNYTHCSEPNSCPFTSQQTPNLSTRISRFQVSSNPYVAYPNSEMIIMEIDQPYGNHNGGDLAFGLDDLLYIALGDGGSFNDPMNSSQDLGKLLGKMLRIDVGNSSGAAPDCDENGLYTIPNASGHFGNPFIDGPGGNCDEIWSYGLRNPWRFSFDRSTGAMYIGDVGQDDWEELNYQPANGGGENWGWRCYEGNHEKNLTDCGDISDYDFPFSEYPHQDGTEFIGCAVTGGYTYRGSSYPYLNGLYIYADNCSDRFWLARRDPQGTWDVYDVGTLSGLGNISTFGEDCYGELFVADYSAGKIYQIQMADSYRLLGGNPSSYLPIIFRPNSQSTTIPQLTPTFVPSPTPVAPDQC